MFREELITILLGAAPIFEVRGAVPVAVGVFGFPIPKAYLLGVFGNILPIVPLFWFLNRFSDYLMHNVYFFNRFFAWLFERTRRKHSQYFERWGLVGLCIFVAVPLPFTGVWSGVVAAFLFGFAFWPAVFMIALGAAGAGIVISVLTAVGLFTAGALPF